MIIVITRNGKRIGISSVVGAVDTRILTGDVSAALSEDLKKLSPVEPATPEGSVCYKVEVKDGHGIDRTLFAVQDPGSPWASPMKRILNEAGIIERI